jgi:tetratricopeptide (TPR) repeat protein
VSRSRGPLLVLLLAGALGAQEPQSPFTVRTVAGDEGAPSRTVVAADVRAIDCLTALRALASACNWSLAIESTPLENTLRFAPVDLNLADQEPRMVAQLLAVAGGADCVFDDAAPAVEGARPTLHVVRTPAADTESGRQRLRTIAGQWYRSFLRDELQHEPVVQREAVNVRMHLGQLLVDSGDLEAAIAFFTDAWQQRPHDQAATAMLRIAECHLDLARGQTDRQRVRFEYGKAEEWARRVLDTMTSAPESTAATVLLGRALLGLAAAETQPDAARERAERCQDELRARVIRLADSVRMLDVWLLAAQAQFLMERPERVLETMLTLRESRWFAELGERQFLDYHFLLGYGALGAKKPDLAMRSLEWFLIHAGTDARRGVASVLLAESYLAQQRFVQARAASVDARGRHLGTMTPAWRERALKVWARTALALGEKENAFQELEQLVLRGEEPELALFLVDQLLADRQWQRAIAVARPLVDVESPFGDRARFKTIEALFAQAAAGDHLDEFPSQAIRLAPRILDPDLRSRTATMIGDAYTRLGKVEHAADAYRGILR